MREHWDDTRPVETLTDSSDAPTAPEDDDPELAVGRLALAMRHARQRNGTPRIWFDRDWFFEHDVDGVMDIMLRDGWLVKRKL